ncbi:hypothetical protein PIB30_077608 [Stylosanthes scabra]|uniref:Uncharacterized protein n=1 Tax=Stylosanthes scabra TaxID=79078 RepID=A0ABU6RQE7_9FABA|nr:hypothetical protein [Stylosanthes scabra]
MPLRSLIFHARAVLCSCRTSSKLFSSSELSVELIMTGKVSFLSKNAYFKVDGRGLRASFDFRCFLHVSAATLFSAAFLLEYTAATSRLVTFLPQTSAALSYHHAAALCLFLVGFLQPFAA